MHLQWSWKELGGIERKWVQNELEGIWKKPKGVKKSESNWKRAWKKLKGVRILSRQAHSGSRRSWFEDDRWNTLKYEIGHRKLIQWEAGEE